MREIVADVFTWQWFSEPHGYDFNGYLVCVEGGNLCIDPVEPSAEVLAEIARSGARTAIHPADAGYARGQGAELDDELQAGERIGPLEVVAVPGKSAGEVAFLWRARRILFVGDAVIGNPPGGVSLLKEKVMDDPPALKASVRRLLELDFDTLLVGDGVPILQGAKRQLEGLVAGFAG
jgi:glyoxylase-like metal-dependent hydrolase (beta-lactamase superfamily II)